MLGVTKLFLILINDLNDAIRSQIVIYSDDTSIYSCHSSKSDIIDNVKRINQKSVVNWCKE